MSNSLVELAKELERQKNSKMDYIVPQQQVEVVYDVDEKTHKLRFMQEKEKNREFVYSDKFNITEHCHYQISQKSGIPYKFYENIREKHPHLLNENINTLLNDGKNLVRTLDGKARAFLSDRYRVMDNYDILFQAMEVFDELNKSGAGIEIIKANLTDTRLYVKATSDNLFGRVFGKPPGLEKAKEGDEVRGGIIITNSEVGASAFRVEPFISVLACTNGMISDRSLARVHLGKRFDVVGEIDWSDETLKLQDMALWSLVKDMIKKTFDPIVFQEWLDDLNQRGREKIEKPTIAVNNVIRNHGLAKARTDLLLSKFAENGFTRWGLSNAITNVAQEVSNYDEQVRMERIGNKIIYEPMKVLIHEPPKVDAGED